MPEALDDALRRYARKTNKPAASIVREAVSTFLRTHASAPAAPRSIAMGASGRDDLSERFEELLFADLTPAGTPLASATAGGRRTRTRPRTLK